MSAISLDPLEAADPRRSAWVSANAGTGKTYALANRVTRLLLDGARPERILCLTYTKAAAAEMAGRLFEQLGDWSMLEDSALSQRIAEIGATERDSEGLRIARRLFALALETPGGLKIQTIHSFCQHLLARFPLEAAVPPSFRVLEDQTAREMVAEARSRVLERAGSGDKTLAQAVAQIAMHADEMKLEAVLQSAVGSDRRKFERLLQKHGGSMAALRASTRSAHGVAASDSYEKIADNFCAEMKREEQHLLKIVSWLRTGTKSDIELSDALGRAVAGGTFDDFDCVFRTQGGTPRAKLATNGLVAENEALHADFKAVASRFLEAEQRCRTVRAAALADASLVLAHAVHAEYSRSKRSRGFLDYDDLITETLQLLEGRDAAAWVLYKLDGGLDHILIDEGQDTSPEQWRIVQRLAEEFFAGSGARDDITRTIFVVGDEKQSIFSFQGADPTQFEIQRAYFAEKARADIGEFINVQLSMSRRSAPEILSFVDEVFSHDAARSGVTADSAPMSHSAFRRHARGRVEFWPTVKPGEIPEPDLWQRPVDMPSPASPVVQLASQLADRICTWTRGRSYLPGHEHPIQPGDIMVLMPRREPFASEVIRALKQRGVPVAGADRIRLKEQIAIMDLIALGRFVLLPEDDLTLAVVLRSPLGGLSEEGLLALSSERSGMLWGELARRRNEAAPYAAAFDFLVECSNRADFSPPYEFYAHILATRGMRKGLLRRLGSEVNDEIDEFLALALAYESLNSPSLEGFLHWLEKGDAEVKRDMERGRNEVRVMTVHGAKGLEADIVVLADTTSVPVPPARRGALLYTDDGVFFPLPRERAPEVVEEAKRKMEEEVLKEHRRLLYVALTRPRDHLHVCGFEGKKGTNNDSWYRLMERAARKLGTTEIAGETPYVFGEAIGESDARRVEEETPKPLPEWILRPAKEERGRPGPTRPSRPEGGEQWFEAPSAARRFDRGLLIHTLLARLPEVADADRREAAEKFLASRASEPADAADLLDEALRVLENPAFASIFAPEARAEVEIVAELPEIGPDIRVSGRIDRLIVQPESVLAVDFKTDRIVPSRVGDVPASHLTQMALYRAALNGVFPGRRIACALLWTAAASLMILPDGILDAQMAQIGARLDRPMGHS